MDFYFGLFYATLLTLANALSIGKHNLLPTAPPTAYSQDSVFENCGFNFNATCDDKMKLFADGNLLVTSDDWKNTSVVYIPPNTGEIEIRCIDGWILGGILASSENGLITNNAWNCSSDNGTTWNNAHELGANGVTSEDISADAKWIWTDRPTWTHTALKRHTTAICKIELPTPSLCDCPFNDATPTPTRTPTPTPTPTPAPSPTPTPGFSLNVTCNNKMELFANEKLLATSYNWRNASQVNIPANTTTIEIHCTDSCWIVEGILASSDDGLVTDDSWNCSSDNGITWRSAHEIVDNKLSVPGISSNAKWISTGPNTWMEGGKVICKVNLDLPVPMTTKSIVITTASPVSTSITRGCLFMDKYVECPEFKNLCKTGKLVDCMNRNCAKTCKCQLEGTTTIAATTSTSTIATTTKTVYLMAGGLSSNNDIEFYSPIIENLTCSITPPPLNKDWTYHTTFFHNNTIHLCGGKSTESICVSYNTDMNESTTHTLTTSRKSGHSSAVLENRVYFIGGNYPKYAGAQWTPLPLTNQPVLTPVPNLDYKGYYQCVVKIDDANLVITGGYGSSGYISAVTRYNSQTSTATSLPSLKQERYRHGCVIVEMDNSKWIIITGGLIGNWMDLQTTEMLELEGSSWVSLGNIKGKRYGHTTIASERGVMIMGGYSKKVGYLASVEMLDWSSKEWNLVQPSLKQQRFLISGVMEIPASMFNCTGQ